MEPNFTRSVLRHRLLTGLKVGLVWTAFDFFFVFGFDVIREPTRELLGRAMEPLLLALPAAVTGLFLVGWMLSFLWRSNSRIGGGR